MLEYLHTPHDLEIPANRQVLLAHNKTNDKDLEEGSPDHVGETLENGEGAPTEVATITPNPSQNSRPENIPTVPSGIVPAAMRQKQSVTPTQPTPTPPTISADTQVPPPANGTVVLDVEQGGIVVPSFVGKSVRSAIELAESSGLDLQVEGSGLAQNQSPSPGAHVASGARITVKFGR